MSEFINELAEEARRVAEMDDMQSLCVKIAEIEKKVAKAGELALKFEAPGFDAPYYREVATIPR